MAYYFPCARIMLRSEFNESEGQYHWALPLAHCRWVHIEGRGVMEWFYLQVKNEISIPISIPFSSGSTDKVAKIFEARKGVVTTTAMAIEGM